MTRTRNITLLVFLLTPVILVGSVVGYHYVTTQMKYDALYHRVKATCLQDEGLQDFIENSSNANLCYSCIQETEDGEHWLVSWSSGGSPVVYIFLIDKATEEIVSSGIVH